jgi:uncharacterized protein YeeX (DUF496 family)
LDALKIQNEAQRIQNDAKSRLIRQLQMELNSVFSQKSRLQKDCESKDALIRKLRKQNVLLKNTSDSLRSGNLPKKVQSNVVHNVLGGKFTNAQITQMIKPKRVADERGKVPIIRMKNLTYQDYAFGLTVRTTGGRKIHNVLRNVLEFPLPGISTMDKEFMWVAFTILMNSSIPNNHKNNDLFCDMAHVKFSKF